MKKIYSKPEILFEDFAVTATIASGCERPCNQNEGTCAFEFQCGPWVMYIFNLEPGSPCSDGAENLVGTEHDGLCYHAPSESFNTFSS